VRRSLAGRRGNDRPRPRPHDDLRPCRRLPRPCGVALPGVLHSADPHPHTRRALARTVGDFWRWADDHGVNSIEIVSSVHVAAWVEQLGREVSPPTRETASPCGLDGVRPAGRGRGGAAVRPGRRSCAELRDAFDPKAPRHGRGSRVARSLPTNSGSAPVADPVSRTVIPGRSALGARRGRGSIDASTRREADGSPSLACGSPGTTAAFAVTVAIGLSHSRCRTTGPRMIP
jgi:hypothetical protein